jgi:hypothetical protein
MIEGIIILAILGALVGFLAYKRHRNPWFFGALAVITSPIIAWAILIALPRGHDG